MSYQGRTNFPAGFRTGVTIQGIPLNWMVSNKAIWVDSVRGGDGNRGTFDRPVATIQKAINTAGDAVCDTIFVKEGHAETISAAGAITFLAKTNVKVIGLGSGRIRPTITFDTGAGTNILMNANNCVLQNLRFSANFANITQAILVSAKGCVIDSCDFIDTAANVNWLTPIKSTVATTAAIDGLQVTSCRWRSPSTACLALVDIASTTDAMIVSGNVVMHEGTLACQLVKVATLKLLTDFECMWNFVSHKMSALEIFISNDGTTNTGIIAHNRVGCADVTTTQDPGWDAGGFRLFDNLISTVDNLSGYVNPAIDVNN